MQRILMVFGTRPEAIKMAPLVRAFRSAPNDFQIAVCVTAQHRQMLDQVLQFFEIKADFDLNLMKPGQNLYSLTADVIVGLKGVLEEFKPHYVFVHGDTTTSTSAALAAFYYGAKVAHIEAGLRTYNKKAPFPEELNRQLTSRIADIHFAPTSLAKNNLKAEGVEVESVFVVGNSVIDALLFAREKLNFYEDDELVALKKIVKPEKKLILVTGHRRENFGKGFIDICEALKEIAEDKTVQIIYPVHLNPEVQKPVLEILTGVENINLISPLSYPSFVWLMNQSYLILTDSGGVQEEAPSLGKPVLVMRETSERPEAIAIGTVKLVGTSRIKIINEVRTLIADSNLYSAYSILKNPYGDGTTANRILAEFMKLDRIN